MYIEDTRDALKRGFAFVTAPNHVRNELLKLNKSVQRKEFNY